jgi:Flp pilus assembly protein TadD
MANALASEQRGDYAAAKNDYEQALQRFPQFLPATRNLAIIYANHLDDPLKGYELAAKARRALPDDAEIAKVLGKLVYRRNEFQYAVQLLKEVEQKKSADAEVYYYLGMSQFRMKQKTDSTSNLQQALKLNLEAKLGDEARRVLAELK